MRFRDVYRGGRRRKPSQLRTSGWALSQIISGEGLFLAVPARILANQSFGKPFTLLHIMTCWYICKALVSTVLCEEQMEFYRAIESVCQMKASHAPTKREFLKDIACNAQPFWGCQIFIKLFFGRVLSSQAVSLLQAATRNLEASVNRYPDDARLTAALSQVQNAARLLAGTQVDGDL
jgi:hypothetical protein